jgi:hypothetical protein
LDVVAGLAGPPEYNNRLGWFPQPEHFLALVKEGIIACDKVVDRASGRLGGEIKSRSCLAIAP